jgi:hypothetical protein
MIETGLAVFLVGCVVTVGVSLTGIMFHWLRGDLAAIRQDLVNHLTIHSKG